MLLGIALTYRPAPMPELRVRLCNQSSLPMDNLVLRPYREEISIRHLSPGQTSNYVPMQIAYPTGYLKVEIDGMEYELFPSGYRQGTPLPLGDYTYALEIDTHQPPTLLLSLIAE